MSDFLDPLRDAAQQQNWSLLNRYLKQLLDRELLPHCSEDLGAHREQPVGDLDRSLALALQLLEVGDFQTKWDVAKLFFSFGSIAIEPLVTLLQNDAAELEARWFAARILGELNHPAAIYALMDVLQNSEDDDLSTVAAEALANLGTAAIAALTELLVNPETRSLAVRALVQIRQPDTIEPLLTVVDDPEVTVRLAAIEALSSFRDPRIPPVLVRALTDTAAPVRRAAIASLGVRSDLAAERDLVSLLSDRLWDISLDVCQQAAMSLGRLGTDAAAAVLFRGLTAPNTPLPLQLEIVRALGWIDRTIALEYLEQALVWTETVTEPLPICQEIVAVLGRCNEPSLKPQAATILMQALASNSAAMQDLSVKQAIALALGQLQQPEALQPLIQLLAESDSGLRLHTIAALRHLDSQQARQQLELVSKRANLSEELRRGVAIALQEWSYTSS